VTRARLAGTRKPCSRPVCPMRYQRASDGEQTRPAGQRGQSRAIRPTLPDWHAGDGTDFAQNCGINFCPRNERVQGRRSEAIAPNHAVRALAETTPTSRATAERRVATGVAAGYATSQIADPVALG